MVSGSYNRTKEHNLKIGLANKGKIRSELHKQFISVRTKKAMKEQTCGEKISRTLKEKYKKGYVNIMKGKKRPDLSLYNKNNPKPGSKNGQWLGGISKLPYGFEFNKKIKNSIKERDKYKCQICDIQFENQKISNSLFLSIHHIDYNKKNNNKNNLICVCNKCNIKCNYNRQYWEWQLKVFMNLFNNFNHDLNMRYKFK